MLPALDPWSSHWFLALLVFHPHGSGSGYHSEARAWSPPQASLGYVGGGIDTFTAEQMIAAACSVDLPRIEDDVYVSVLDECGGHTNDYHFHEGMACLYETLEGSTHSTKVTPSCQPPPPHSTRLVSHWFTPLPPPAAPASVPIGVLPLAPRPLLEHSPR